MSRSYKKQPFMAICGGGSARWDKTHAHRAERRVNSERIQYALRNDAWEEFLPAKKRECPHNDVWGWCRDGNQVYCGLEARHWFDYYLSIFDPSNVWYKNSREGVYPPMWYTEMMRK